MAFSQKYMDDYNRKMQRFMAAEIEKATIKAMVYACQKLRPELDPKVFVDECMAEAKKLRDDKPKVITLDRELVVP